MVHVQLSNDLKCKTKCLHVSLPLYKIFVIFAIPILLTSPYLEFDWNQIEQNLGKKNQSRKLATVGAPGFDRDYQPPKGLQIFLIILSENCMKMKKFWAGARIPCPLPPTESAEELTSFFDS